MSNYPYKSTGLVSRPEYDAPGAAAVHHVLVKDTDGNVIADIPKVYAPSSWSERAVQVTATKFFRKSLGECSVYDLVNRVACKISTEACARGYLDTVQSEIFREDIRAICLGQYASFNSPVWFNIGVPDHPQRASACFIQGVEDNLQSILALQNAEATVFKFGGGSGTNWSRLRASIELIRDTGACSSGPLSFVRASDGYAGTIKSGSIARRAAKMVVLDVDHPDVRAFIKSKPEAERMARALIAVGYSANAFDPDGAYAQVPFQNANHSVRVTDAFMELATGAQTPGQTLEHCLTYRTPNPNGNVADTVDARGLLREIVQAAWECGDPGLQFVDTINAWNCVPKLGEIRACNPCCLVGETLVKTNEGLIRMDELTRRSVAGEALPMAACFNPVGQKPAWRQIRKAWCAGQTERLVTVRTVQGMTFKCTPEHHFYLHDDTRQIDAQFLHPDMALEVVGTHADGSDKQDLTWFAAPHQRVRDTLNQPVALTAVYDLEVDELHNFAITMEGQHDSVIVSNSEFVFPDDSACNLASINLLKFQNPDGTFDWRMFKSVIHTLILAQDILCDFADYPTEAIARNSRNYRPLGLGYANLGALLMSQATPYDSDRAVNLTAEITSFMTAHAYLASAAIARVKGPYAGWEANKDAHAQVIQKHAHHAKDSTDFTNALWAQVVEAANTTSFRNAQVTLLAPTGTIGFMMDCDSFGIEPVDAVVKEKSLVGGNKMTITARCADAGAKKLGYDSYAVWQTAGNDPSRHYADLEHDRAVFATAMGSNALDWRAHLKIMAAAQPFLSGAISKTVNMPGTCTVDDILAVYYQAWKLGLKSISVYRDGCKQSQPIKPVEVGAATSMLNMVVQAQHADKLGAQAQPKHMQVQDEVLLSAGEWVGETQPLDVQLDRETDGRHIAEVSSVPGAMAYGSTPEEATEKARQIASRTLAHSVPHRTRLPTDRQSRTHKFNVGGHEGYITAGMYKDGRLGEVFVKMAKEGSVVSGLMDCIATLISITLQYGVPLEVLSTKLKGARFEPEGFTGNPKIQTATSLVDYLFRWLELEFGESTGAIELPVTYSGLAAELEHLEHDVQTVTKPSTAQTHNVQVLAPNPAGHTASSSPACPNCGNLMTRAGTCHTCPNCAFNTGCS